MTSNSTETQPPSSSTAMERKPAVLHAIERATKQITGRLPAGMTPDKFMYGLITCVQKNPALLNCEQASVLLAAYEAAELGISLSPTLQLGYLIPYGQKAQFQVSYRGMVQKAYESGAVTSFFAEVVYANDRFERQFAPKRNVFHAPADGDRGTAIGAYALVEFKDGHIEFEYLTAEQIATHKKQSKQQNSLMWTQFWEEAWRKTAIRVLSKRLPLANPGFEKLVEVINTEAERELDVTPPAPAPKVSTVATLKERLTAPSAVEAELAEVWPAEEAPCTEQVNTQTE